MVWWQIILIVVGSIIIGLSIGYLINILIIRTASVFKKKQVRPVQASSIPSQQVIPEPSVPDLFAEIEYNRRIATKEWTGVLQTFQTQAWDNRGDEVHSLAVEVRNELTEAYSDMALANSISWLSTEMSRRSPSLDESYSKLRASIAVRLNKVRFQLTEEGSATGTDKVN
jgi:hypothetical protein